MKIINVSLIILIICSLSVSAQWSTSGTTITNTNLGDVKINSSSRVYFDNSGSNQGFLYDPIENDSGTGRYFLRFHFENNDSYPFLTNRTPNGKVVIKTGITAGGGEISRLTIEGGDGIVKSYFMDTNLGIGTTNPSHKLTVAGTINSKEIIVEETAGADFVFADDYDLPTLEEIEAFISQNNHLPGIAPATEMIEQGVKVGELQIQLLQKIEELTLHAIGQQKMIESLIKNNIDLSKRIQELEKSNSHE